MKRNGEEEKWECCVGGWVVKHSKDLKAMKTTDMYFETSRKSHLSSGITTLFKKWELPVSRETPIEVKLLSKRLE